MQKSKQHALKQVKGKPKYLEQMKTVTQPTKTYEMKQKQS